MHKNKIQKLNKWQCLYLILKIVREVFQSLSYKSTGVFWPFSMVSHSLSSVVVFGSLLQISGVLVTTAYIYRYNRDNIYLPIIQMYMFMNIFFQVSYCIYLYIRLESEIYANVGFSS